MIIEQGNYIYILELIKKENLPDSDKIIIYSEEELKK